MAVGFRDPSRIKVLDCDSESFRRPYRNGLGWIDQTDGPHPHEIIDGNNLTGFE